MEQIYPTDDRLRIKTNKGFIFKHLHEIVRFEAAHNHTLIYLINCPNPFVLPENLGKIEYQYMQPDFFRTHKSHIVNLKHVEQYETKSLQVYTSNGVVPLAEDRVKDFEKKMLK